MQIKETNPIYGALCGAGLGYGANYLVNNGKDIGNIKEIIRNEKNSKLLSGLFEAPNKSFIQIMSDLANSQTLKLKDYPDAIKRHIKIYQDSLKKAEDATSALVSKSKETLKAYRKSAAIFSVAGAALLGFACVIVNKFSNKEEK